MGLLLLRTAVGATAIVQGALYFANDGGVTIGASTIGVLLVVAGASLLIGLLTPVVAALVGLSSVAVAFAWLPSPHLKLFEAPWPAVFLAVVTAALLCLGPGSLSMDARLFGRREIIIPSKSRSQIS